MNKPDYISKPDWDILITKYSENKLKKHLKRNYPYQYLIGNVEFYNSKIIVNKNVLIPRWETEDLVDKIVKKIKKSKFKPKTGLDLCTGSGCIAISLSKELEVPFIAVDTCKKALKVAKENVAINKANVSLIKSDVLKGKLIGTFDIIVSNPPYVGYNEPVDKETEYQPKKALYAKNNGLYFYEVLLEKIKDNLSNKYLIAMEINSALKDKILEIAKNNYPDSIITIEKDLYSKDRFLFITNIE